MSHETATADPLEPTAREDVEISLASWSSFSFCRAASTTFASPSIASALAIASPIPSLAPVMTTTLSASGGNSGNQNVLHCSRWPSVNNFLGAISLSQADPYALRLLLSSENVNRNVEISSALDPLHSRPSMVNK